MDQDKPTPPPAGSTAGEQHAPKKEAPKASSQKESPHWREKVDPVPQFLTNDKKTQKSSDPRLKTEFAQEEFEEEIDEQQYVLSLGQRPLLGFAFSLCLLGVLFFVGGFLTALSLVAYHAAFRTSVEQTGEWFWSKPGNASELIQEYGPNVNIKERITIHEKQEAPRTKYHIKLPETVHKPVNIPESHKDTPHKAPVAKTPEKAHYALQLGAFKQEEYAHKLAREYRNKGHSPVIRRGKDQTGRILFYVTLGTYSASHEAKKAAQEVSKKMGTQNIPIVILNPEQLDDPN
ncbi:MAG: SPOR domain-containing protein [Alphaproteobacteria bacterium]|jgi:hypothetical protein|nr:SPOR domain-containing protein [Alphaproteobacteria bacterium]MBT5390083.1 SPOR domain-containing protein [Alphaproteobacteria bacterium]MBT5540542.1 SPOR domain-containing protein [Alphaproteobacteria bacterium]MBT5655013.1 SPOR domain-containing protein [Alphaproteobacteria bacterium]